MPFKLTLEEYDFLKNTLQEGIGRIPEVKRRIELSHSKDNLLDLLIEAMANTIETAPTPEDKEMVIKEVEKMKKQKTEVLDKMNRENEKILVKINCVESIFTKFIASKDELVY